MEHAVEFPRCLEIDAYAGGGSRHRLESPLSKNPIKWTYRNMPAHIRPFLKSRGAPNYCNWRDERVGWGLVLPYNTALSIEDNMTAIDAPEPIQELVRARTQQGVAAPVLRFHPGQIGYLLRGSIRLRTGQSGTGLDRDSVPHYLLIYATPDKVPWTEQYALNSVRCVGRLCLEGEPLANYVNALLSDWQSGERADPDAAVVWAVDHGMDDITKTMRLAIAEPVFHRLSNDTQVGPNTRYLDGSTGAATKAGLAGALEEARPGFILSTSHGMTSPLDDVTAMAAQLGILVDNNYATVDAASLLAAWVPGGAIWYAHACCSAGSDGTTAYDGLLEAGSPVDLTLKGIARCGATVAPLPQALLGARHPLRAFIGHVEPTFNWTLQHTESGQFTTANLVDALYERLFQPQPVGNALRQFYRQIGWLYDDVYTLEKKQQDAQMLHRLLIARDLRSTVVLGDPTAMLPLN